MAPGFLERWMSETPQAPPPPQAATPAQRGGDSLAQLQLRLQAFAQARGWGRFHAPKNLACALAVEAAELLEPFQWLSEAQSRELDAAQHTHVQQEMADVLLYLVQLADALGIDVVQAAHDKMNLNAQRFPAGPA
jgi:NTP pyrophosphatase (non-canonical NTP hydrolase)